MARALHFFVLGLALSGCYLSHERRAHAARTDAAVPADAAAPADAAVPIDAPIELPCRWEPVPPWQLTSPPGDRNLLDVATLPSGEWLVAWGSSNDPPVPPGRRVERVDLRATLAPPIEVFPAARGHFLGGMGVAVGPAGLLAATWDDAGCTVRALALDGAPIAAARALTLSTCAGVHATATGFALFDRPGDAPAALHALAPDGSPAGEGPPIAALERAFWWARAPLDDGTQLVIGMDGGPAPARAVAQRLDARGAPLTMPGALPAFGAASRVRAVATPGGALVAWLEQPEGDADSQDREVRTFAVDRDGRPLSAPRAIGRAYRDAGHALARLRDGEILSVRVEHEPGDRYGRETRLVAERLDDRGAPLERIVLAEGILFRTPVARARPGAALVAYTAPGTGPPGSTQVFVTGLECVAE